MARPLGNVCLVHVAHMIDHLVFSRETIFTTSMTTWMLTIVELKIGSIVNDINVSLQICLPSEAFLVAGTRFPKTEPLGSVTSRQIIDQYSETRRRMYCSEARAGGDG